MATNETNTHSVLRTRIEGVIRETGASLRAAYIEQIAQQLARYFGELQHWNEAMRLVGQGDETSLLAHLADSLAVYPLLQRCVDTVAGRPQSHADEADGADRDAGGTGTPPQSSDAPTADRNGTGERRAIGRGARVTIADVGSGNGMPAIPLALCAPHCHFVLVESSQKRCAFLRNVVALLKMYNCTVIRARIEDVARRNRRQRIGWHVLTARALTHWSGGIATACAECLHTDGAAIVYAHTHSAKSKKIAALLRPVFPRVEYVTYPMPRCGQPQTQTFLCAARSERAVFTL